MKTPSKPKNGYTKATLFPLCTTVSLFSKAVTDAGCLLASITSEEVISSVKWGFPCVFHGLEDCSVHFLNLNGVITSSNSLKRSTVAGYSRFFMEPPRRHIRVSSLSTHDKGLSVAVEPWDRSTVSSAPTLLSTFGSNALFQVSVSLRRMRILWLWVCDGNSPFIISVPQNNGRKHILICKSTWLSKLTLSWPSKIILTCLAHYAVSRLQSGHC